MAIEIKMTGYCKDCPRAELKLDFEYLTDIFDPSEDRVWSISCQHEAACERIFKGRFAKGDDQ